MRSIIALPVLVLLPVLLLAAATPAQSAGDAVVLMHNVGTNHFLGVTSGGVVTTVLSRTPVQRGDDLMVAPANRGFVFGEVGGTSRQDQVTHWIPGGAISTLTVLPATFTTVPDYAVDQGSDIVVLNASGTARGVYSMPGIGGPLTTVAKLSGNGFLFAMEEDLVSGDLVVYDSARTLHRIRKSGTVTTVRYTPPPAISLAIQGNVHVDHRTGLHYLTYTSYLMTVDPNTGATTSVIKPATNDRWTFYGIDADPYRGGFLLNADRVQPTTGKYLLNFDPILATLSTVATLPTMQQADLAIAGTRMLTGLTRPSTGNAYKIHLSIPPEAGKGYFAAASFGTLAGIGIPGGRRVQLDADALFFLSVQVPAIFANFQGALDGNGIATPTVNIPGAAALVGVRFFVAVVTFDAVGVRVITEPLGITIE